jgi:uncharacterized protein (TIGR03000 family)
MRYLTIAAVALALLIPNDAFAQRHGGGGGGGHPSGGGGGSNWHGGGGGGNWGGGHWDGGHNNNYWYPGLAFGLGYAAGSWGWPGYGYGGYGYGYPYYSYDYPSYYSYDYPSYYGYNYPSYDNGYGYPRTSSYYEPNGGGSYMSPNRARLEIMVPDPNATLLIQGQPMSVTGNQRVFTSPDLEPGREYTYTITLRHPNGQEDTRDVDVRAGSNMRVDFSQPQVNTMPAPKVSGERLPPQGSSPPPAYPPK